MSPFLHRLHQSDGDVRYRFWGAHLIARRLSRGCDSAGHKLRPCQVGRILF